jgi:hypothetical protein
LRVVPGLSLGTDGAVQMAARQSQNAVVDPQLHESPVGPAIGNDRDRNVGPPGITVEVEDHLLEPAWPSEVVADRVERHAERPEPRAQLGDVRFECARQ